MSSTRICYLVLAHRLPRALWALLDAIEHPLSTAVVHVDARADLSQFSQPREGVTFIENRSRGYHHGWGIAEATLALIEQAPAADRYVLLSGDAFPLADQAHVRSVLDADPTAEWIDLLGFPAPHVRKEATRLTRYHVQHDPRGSRLARFGALSANRLLPRRDPTAAFGGMTPWCGAQWWMLSAAAIAHIRAEVSRRPEFVDFCHNIGTPDELFFHTLLASSEALRSRVRTGAMFADFSVIPGPAEISERHITAWTEHGFSGTDECGLHPEYLFARKVRSPEIASTIRTSVWSLARPKR